MSFYSDIFAHFPLRYQFYSSAENGNISEMSTQFSVLLDSVPPASLAFLTELGSHDDEYKQHYWGYKML